MTPVPTAGALVLSVVVTVVVVMLSALWQPNTSTPVAVQAAVVFLAVALTLGRFRQFRRH